MMIKRNKIISISVAVSFVLIVILFLSLKGKVLNKSIDVKFIKNGGENIISVEEIRNIVLHQYPNFVNMNADEINLSLLEIEIEKNPSVKDADVFKKFGGILSVEIEQRIPIVRVINNKNKSFYIDTEGSLMPISKIKSARVVVANGNIKKQYKNVCENIFADSVVNKTLIDIYKIVVAIQKDKFLTAQIEQIYVTNSKEYELVPMVGRHTVMLGDTFNLENKLVYLKYFYQNVLNKVGWNQYTYINIKFNGQIVCTKKE